METSAEEHLKNEYFGTPLNIPDEFGILLEIWETETEDPQKPSYVRSCNTKGKL